MSGSGARGGGFFRRVGIIARREFATTIARREFWLVTLGLPVLYFVIGAAVMLATTATVRSAESKQAPRTVGFLDRSGLLDAKTLAGTVEGVKGTVFPTEAAGKAAVRERKVRAFVVVPPDFAQGGVVTVYEPGGQSSLFGEEVGPRLYERPLRRALLAGKVAPETLERALGRIEARAQVYEPATDRFETPDPLRLVRRFALPYIFSMLLMLCTLFASSYLLHGIVEEKENRVIEVLLSAATHEELLTGKMLGLGAVGLLQLVLWSGGGIALSLVIAAALPEAARAVAVAPGVLATACLMFLLGYALYASLMAGVGSMGTSWRESQQMAGIATLFLVVPLMLITAILEDPDGSTARFVSLFPLTAPIGMMLRVAAGGSSLVEVLICAALLALTTWGVIRLCARLLRLSLLMYGQRPTIGRIGRFLLHGK
jgi:ABC-type Na+ efflux pump, permease component